MKITWAFILSITFTFLLIATVTLIIIHPVYYKISLPLTPHPYFYKEVQGDTYSNGNSEGDWIDSDKGSWQCLFGNKLNFPFCSFQIYLGNGKDEGLDLSLYNEVELDIKYEGTLESLRVYMRNYNSEYSKGKQDYDSTKYMRVEVDSKDFDSKLSLNLDEFAVADWWLEGHKLPRHLRFQSLNNIILFGIQVQPKKRTEQIQNITVSSITMHGVSLSKEQLYFYIITFWCSVICIIILCQFMRMLNQIGMRDKSLKRLKKDNSQLFVQKVGFEQLSRIDPLTQINNRAGIDFYIEEQIKDNLRGNFVVGMIDADHFKKLNDTYGHDTGDEVLKKIANILTRSIRQNDCVGRWGGEEFLITLSNISLQKAYDITNKIRLKIQKTTFDVSLNNEIMPVNVTISAGIYQAKNTLEIYEAIKSADKYLYKAKDIGRNRVKMKE